jgi:hypothetical protein
MSTAPRVCAVDADGNEVAGIRLPPIAVPLGAYTGWNVYRAQRGLCRHSRGGRRVCRSGENLRPILIAPLKGI